MSLSPVSFINETEHYTIKINWNIVGRCQLPQPLQFAQINLNGQLITHM